MPTCQYIYKSRAIGSSGIPTTGFACKEGTNGKFCIFHDKEHFAKNEKKVTKRFEKKLKESLSKEEPLNCAGYYLPDIDFTKLLIDKTFPHPVSFIDTTFYQGVNFSGFTFSKEAFFMDATFLGEITNFAEATFSGIAAFDGARFSTETRFGRATFVEETSFLDSTFNDEADFSNARFNDKADFTKTIFTKKAFFYDTSVTGQAREMRMVIVTEMPRQLLQVLCP